MIFLTLILRVNGPLGMPHAISASAVRTASDTLHGKGAATRCARGAQQGSLSENGNIANDKGKANVKAGTLRRRRRTVHRSMLPLMSKTEVSPRPPSGVLGSCDRPKVHET